MKKFKHSGAGSSSVISGLAKMEKNEVERTRLKFETALFIAKEELPLTKFEKVLDLEKHHGVKVGEAYKNNKQAGIFIDCIGETIKSGLAKRLSHAKFLSVLCDGSTDSSVKEQEAIYVTHFDPEPAGKNTVETKIEFLTVNQLKSQTADGLYNAIVDSYLELDKIDKDFETGLNCFDEQTFFKKLVGFTSDGASVNRGENQSVKALLREKSPWLIFIWCIAHRLELAMKDSLSKDKDFMLIDNFLLRMFYLYHKAPKKLRLLKEYYETLKEGIEFDEGGVKPLRSNGTRWITHKVNAMKMCIDKWGIYISHLENLSMDTNIPSGDRSKLKGYLREWSKCKVPLLLALYIDLLSILSRLSLTFQGNDIDIVIFINSLKHAKSSLEKFERREFEKLPYVANFLSKINKTEEGEYIYQDIELKDFDTKKEYVKNKKNYYLEIVKECLHSRLEEEPHSKVIFQSVPQILNCEGWSDKDEEFADEHIVHLCEHFEEPLKNAGTDTSIPVIMEQWHLLLEFAKEFLTLTGVSYVVTWPKIFSSPRKKDWKDLLNLISLLFTLPVSNAKLERMFSKLKRIKTLQRASLGANRLENLLRIVEDGPNVENFDAIPAMEYWANQKDRRLNQKPRKKYAPREVKSNKIGTLSDTDNETDSDGEIELFKGAKEFTNEVEHE